MAAPQIPDGLPELLATLSTRLMTVPDEVAQYALRRGGDPAADPLAARLAALAAERFAADVLEDAALAARARAAAPQAHRKAEGFSLRERRLALTTEDLAGALARYGVRIAPLPYLGGGSGGGKPR